MSFTNNTKTKQKIHNKIEYCKNVRINIHSYK